MKKWKDILIKTKLYSGFAFGVLAFVLTMLFSIMQLQQISEKASILSRPRQDIMLVAAGDAHIEWANKVQAFVLHEGQTPLDAALDGRQCAFGRWFYGPEKIKLAESLPALKPIFEQIDTTHLNLHKSATQIKEAVGNQKVAEAKNIYENTTLPNLREVQKLLVASTNEVSKNTAETVAGLQADISLSTNVSIIMGILGILIGTALAIVICRSICVPLGKLAEYAHLISSGKFSFINIDQKDEAGQLATAFNHMVRAIKSELGITQGIMRGLTVPFIMCDTEGKVTYINQQMLDCWGHTGKPTDYYGQKSGTFFYNNANTPSMLDQVLATSTPMIHNEINRENIKGEKKHLFIDASPLWDLDGVLIGAFSLHNDLTEMYTQQGRVAALNDRIYSSANDAQRSPSGNLMLLNNLQPS